MNKWPLFIIIIGIFSLNIFGQNNPLDVFTSNSLLDENGSLLNDGDVVQLIYAGANNTIDPPVMNIGNASNGQPTGDDIVLSLHQIGENVPPATGMFFFTITTYPDHNSGYPAAGDYIYARVFNENNLTNATHYGDGQLYLITNQLGSNYEVQLSGGQTGYPLPIKPIHNLNGIPQKYKLGQNYPNPFNPTTHFRIEIPMGGEVSETQVAVYDIAGRKIKTLVHSVLLPGAYELTWNGENEKGAPAAGGIYLLIMKNLYFSEAKKLVFLR